MSELKMQAKFDPDKCRQYLNNELTVFHCHHYTALFSQLADDAALLKGAKLLAEAAAESMLVPLKKYCNENGLTTSADKTAIAEQYFAYVGLGCIKIDVAANTAIMTSAHVDDGWIKKWGKRAKPVNFIGQGFVAAAFALANDDAPDAYQVDEIESIVSGADASKFTITKK